MTDANVALEMAYLDISHTLLALECNEPWNIDRQALQATLDDIRGAYTGVSQLTHEHDQLEEDLCL